MLIIGFGACNAVILLNMNIGALSNQGIYWVSFNIINEMYWEIALWILELLATVVFIVGGLIDEKTIF